MLFKVFFVLCVCASVFCNKLPGFPDHPGTKITFTPEGFQRGVRSCLPDIIAKITKLTFPTIHGNEAMPIGNISYVLSDMKFLDMKAPNIKADSFNKPNEIHFLSFNTSAMLTLAWSYEDQDWPYVKDQGTADITIYSNTDGTGRVFAAADGSVEFEVIEFMMNIETFDLKIHGGSAWIYNMFIEIFKKQLIHMIETKFVPDVKNLLQKFVDDVIKKVHIWWPVYHDIVFDTRLFDKDMASLQYFVVPMAGRFALTGTPTKDVVPFNPPDNLPNIVNNKDCQIIISEQTLSSYHAAEFAAGHFGTHTMAPADVPAKYGGPVLLNTAHYKDKLPALYIYCPDCNMTVDVAMTTYPVTSLDYGGVNVQVNNNVTVNVDGKPEAAFILGQDASFIATYKVVQPSTSGHLKTFADLYDQSFKVLKSNIGTVNVNELQRELMIMTQVGIVEWINTVWNEKTYLPLPTFFPTSFINPKTSVGDGFLLATLDYKEL